MKRRDWRRLLLDIYQDCRTLPEWDGLKAMYDDEDREYFDMLDVLHS